MDKCERAGATPGGCAGNVIKTHFAQIVTRFVNGEPYYEILYFDPADGTYHVGYGSYHFHFVTKWLAEDFDLTPANMEVHNDP